MARNCQENHGFASFVTDALPFPVQRAKRDSLPSEPAALRLRMGPQNVAWTTFTQDMQLLPGSATVYGGTEPARLSCLGVPEGADE
jgi:hypothetical protein